MESIAKTNALITKALEARDQRKDLQPEIREKTWNQRPEKRPATREKDLQPETREKTCN